MTTFPNYASLLLVTGGFHDMKIALAMVATCAAIMISACDMKPENAELCAMTMKDVENYLDKKDYSMAEAAVNAGITVTKCDSEEYKELKERVGLASLIGENYKSDRSGAELDAWEVSTDTSKLTDKTTVTIATRSEPLQGSYGTKQARLILRCSEDKETNVYWDWDEYLGSGDIYGNPDVHTLLVRLDDAKAETYLLRHSTDGTAVGMWDSDEAIKFIRKLETAKQLIAGITPYNEGPREAEFDVASLSKHLPQLQEACGWK